MSKKGRYKYKFEPDTEYEILRADEYYEIEKRIVMHISARQWIGMFTLSGVYHKDYLENVMKPRVQKIARHIYDNGLCVHLYLATVTEAELWKLIE